MIGFLIASQHKYFHPSVFGLAGSPKGRAPRLAPVLKRLNSHATTARLGVNLGVVLALMVATSVSAVLLVSTFETGNWIMIGASALPLVASLILGQLDRVFWLVRRAHDVGKSWAWVGAAFIVFPLTLMATAAGHWIFDSQIMTVAGVISVIAIGIPCLMLLPWLTYAPGQADTNRYGPAPEPIPDYWFD
jgi:uncharacterized membrane protein YhaH (DUF805 family)